MARLRCIGLFLLNDKIIQLDGIRSYAECYQSYEAQGIYGKSGSGQLYIRNASMTGSGSVILAGTFGFVANDAIMGRIEVYFGRFDFIIENHQLWEVP